MLDGWSYHEMPDLTGRVYLVTGGNSGVAWCAESGWRSTARTSSWQATWRSAASSERSSRER